MLLDYNEINKMEIKSNIYFDTLSKNPGQEPYKLLAYMAEQINGGILIDISTNPGTNAAALSQNKNNTVYTFDIYNTFDHSNNSEIWTNNNVIYSKDNIIDSNIREKFRDLILKSAIIFLDIHPHNGTDEHSFYDWLTQINYKGILIADDIWYFKDMRDNFWYKIPSNIKYDVTMLGHFSGTGIICFNDQKFEIHEKAPDRISKYNLTPKSWTVVTAYFDLTKMPDASNQIKERDIKHYMRHANMTMSLEQNLVVYCDKESELYLRSIRPKYLENNTKYILLDFPELDIVNKYYNRLVDIRKKTGYNADPRNTSSYYLLCMARYEILLRTMKENPFHSTHFAWCNICIERMSWKSGIFFPKIWQEFRDKFSTCYIDYQPKSLVIDNIKEYYKWGRCGMCSGFFTGNICYMTEFCNEILKAFDDMLLHEVGHADEQLFSIVYFKRPELFEFYLGDYSEMINSYGWIYDRPFEPVKNIIRNLNNSNENNHLLYELTSRWLQSYYYGCFSIDENTVNWVRMINQNAKQSLNNI